ncbi:putative nuclear localization protein [Neofusicoccum parvum UCRNP2]|uniref:Putative nuclear localization protein n=1 Tax=Botryosphaeria parva (strain UCR-NP2) TaxID=1287680 RepID=R1ETF7_BOTPV|nr:putative nuclear localization protein [Neofusicoccum parvum UCRNP2]
MPPRRSRAAAAASTPIRTPTPAVAESDADAQESQDETPVEQDGDDDVATPAQDPDDEAEAEAEPEPPSERSSPVVQQFPRKRRLGRPPKNRPPDWDNADSNNDNDSQRGTPAKRRRGRPSTGGFRGRPRGGPSHVTRVPIDKEGNLMDVVDDEVALPEDPEGEQKVDKMGNLKGGRDYRVRVFTITGRGERLYMLSTEPARCCGFRDSYLFFTKHMQLYKIIVNEDEKRDLIDREIIPHSYKGRAIGVVTARSVFREFGARIIIGGRRIIDDYYVRAARERGDVEGEIADPNDRLPGPGEPYNKNQYVAWHGASAVYHTGGPSVPMPNGKVVPGKRRINITSANWQFEHARAASRFNSVLVAARRANVEGVYDAHTNQLHFPKIMQPTHARWEELPVADDDLEDAEAHSQKRLTNGTSGLTNGVHETNGSTNGTVSAQKPGRTNFGPVPAVVARNFLIVDTYLESAPITGAGVPGPDGDFHDVGVNGLPKVNDEILAELPSECREALEDAQQKEQEWKSRWHTESIDGSRRELKIGFTGVPV